VTDAFIRYTDISDLYQHGDIDGIIIATPAATHAGIAKELLHHSYDLLIEKPLALSLQEALEIQALSKKAGAHILVGHIQLYNPAYLLCKELLLHVGQLQRVSFKGLVSTPRPDISLLWDWGPHPISIFLDLIRAPLLDVAGSAQGRGIQFSLTYPDVVAE